MRSSLGGKHVSGQERIVRPEEVEEVILELHRRPKGDWDFQSIKIERLKETPIVLEKSLPVRSYKFPRVGLARSRAAALLEDVCGINAELVRHLFEKLSRGVKDGENLRGALLVDPWSGEILAENIRTILFDWLDRKKITERLLKRGFTTRTVDALALATKNVFCGVEAEICISDDPDYTTGYIASQRLGYLRMTPLKEKGNPLGGRVYFVKKEKLEKVIQCLRSKPVLIAGVSL